MKSCVCRGFEKSWFAENAARWIVRTARARMEVVLDEKSRERELVAGSVAQRYDLIIVGAGPGGYEMAAHAARAGQSVLLIERDQLGGVCLNWGCIPTKSLLHSAKQYVQAQRAAAVGVIASGVQFDLAQAMAWKREVVETLRADIAGQMKRLKVTVLNGVAQLLTANRLAVDGAIYEGRHVVIATGSSPIVPPIPGADLPHVMTSREILEIDRLPQSLAVIGGGVIGVEFASFFSSLGVEVTIIEQLDEIIPSMDRSQAKRFRSALRKKMTFELGSRALAIAADSVRYVNSKGEENDCAADAVLLAVGRAPNLSGLGLEEVGVEFSARGIQTDAQMRTNVPNLYAIGDVTGQSQLAHSATRMGEVALNTILGRADRFRADTIPWAVYSSPEAAGCGWSEQRAQREGYAVESASLPLRMSGRFLAENGQRGAGQVKVVIDSQSRRILGMHAFGAYSSEFIFGAAVMLEAQLSVDEVQKVVFPHPTVGEVIRATMFQFE